MANRKVPTNPDIVVDNDDERAYWCEFLGCTPQELRAVLKFTDESVEQVRRGLESHRGRGG